MSQSLRDRVVKSESRDEQERLTRQVAVPEELREPFAALVGHYTFPKFMADLMSWQNGSGGAGAVVPPLVPAGPRYIAAPYQPLTTPTSRARTPDLSGTAEPTRAGGGGAGPRGAGHLEARATSSNDGITSGENNLRDFGDCDMFGPARPNTRGAPAQRGEHFGGGTGRPAPSTCKKHDPPVPDAVLRAQQRVKKHEAAARGAAGKPKRTPYVPTHVANAELCHLVEDTKLDPTSIDDVTFDDVVGQDAAERALLAAIVRPVKRPQWYGSTFRRPKGILLYGPPGTGKTMLAKAVARTANCTFFDVSPSDLVSKWRGESEKIARVLLDMARHYSPSIIFIDEIDALCGQRRDDQHEASRRMLSELLKQIDGIRSNDSKHVMLLGATNRPWDIDGAMIRRLRRSVYVPLPDTTARAALLRRLATDPALIFDGIDFDAFSRELEDEHFSAADITSATSNACDLAADRVEASGDADNTPRLPVSLDDLRTAFSSTPAAVDLETLQRLDAWGRSKSARR